MKKIHSLATVILFLFNIHFSFSQDCLPESRVDDVESNKAVAKCLKFFCQDNEIIIKTPAFGPYKTVKGEYLRHSFPQEWDVKAAEDGNTYRSGYVIVAIKTDNGCRTVALYVEQISLGLNTWGTMKATDNFSSETQKYYKEKLDCDCIMKQKDWLAK